MGQLCSACLDDEFFQIVLLLLGQVGFVKAFFGNHSAVGQFVFPLTNTKHLRPDPTAFFKGKRTEPVGMTFKKGITDFAQAKGDA